MGSRTRIRIAGRGVSASVSGGRGRRVGRGLGFVLAAIAFRHRGNGGAVRGTDGALVFCRRRDGFTVIAERLAVNGRGRGGGGGGRRFGRGRGGGGGGRRFGRGRRFG